MYCTFVKFPCIIHVEGGQLVEARKGNRVLPSAGNSTFNNVNWSVYTLLKYGDGILGGMRLQICLPYEVYLLKGWRAFSGLSSFQNFSYVLLIDSYRSLLVVAVSSGRGFFWFVFYPITTPFQKRLFYERPNTCPHVGSFTKGELLSNEWDWYFHRYT